MLTVQAAADAGREAAVGVLRENGRFRNRSVITAGQGVSCCELLLLKSIAWQQGFETKC